MTVTSLYRKISFDLLIILIWVLIAFFFITNHMNEKGLVRTFLGIPLILFVPGYVLIATLYPKKGDLGLTERIFLSVGLSVVIVPIIGLLLNFTSGIRLIPILFTLCSYSIILIFIAHYRRIQVKEDSRFEIPFYKLYDWLKTDVYNQSIADKILTLILIISVISTAWALVNIIKTPNTGEKFTEFYILDSSGNASNYQTELKVNEPIAYKIGISNHEYRTVNYSIKTVLDKDILLSKEVTIDNNQTWEQNLTVTPNKMVTGKELNFWLFKENNSLEPYRELHLWVNVT